MIDPTDPAVLDVHDFRRAGEFKRLQRQIVLSDPPANPVVAVPPDSPLDVQLLLESVIDGVLVTGEIEYPMRGQCSRCLEPVEGIGQTEFSQLYLWSAPEIADSEPLPLVEQGFIDITSEVRDAIGLDLPLAPVCSQECPGLCPRCGVRLAEVTEHRHDDVDPRWAALGELQFDTDDTAE